MSYNSKKVILIPLGTKFGKITVIGGPIKHTTGKTTRAMFHCKCDCGKETFITGSQLRTNKRVKCSTCAYKTRPQSTERYSNIERLYNLSIISRCKNTKGRIKNELNLKDFENLISQNCYYCDKEPSLIKHMTNNRIVKRGELFANGIDRLDSNKHYNLDNCVPCCKQCNSMKMNYSKDEFLEKIKKIYNKWNKQEDIIKEN